MNKLAAWLKAHRIQRQVFARTVGISNSYVSQLCAEPPTYWPSRDVIMRIRDATGGEVTANDFLPPEAAA